MIRFRILTSIESQRSGAIRILAGLSQFRTSSPDMLIGGTMVDIVTKQQRSARMARIRGKDTRPEILVRQGLFRMGYRFRLHRKIGKARPDIVFIRKRVAVFVQGCFWHQHQGCRHYRIPKSNIEFWTNKLTKNSSRDRRNIESLRDEGWRVALIWECAISEPSLIDELSDWILSTQPFFVASEVGGARSVTAVEDLELPSCDGGLMPMPTSNSDAPTSQD